MRPVDPERISPTMTEPATPDTTPLASYTSASGSAWRRHTRVAAIRGDAVNLEGGGAAPGDGIPADEQRAAGAEGQGARD